MRVFAKQECFVENMIRPEGMVFDIPDHKKGSLCEGVLEKARRGERLGIRTQDELDTPIREQLRNLGQGIPDQTPPPPEDDEEGAEPDEEVAAPPTRSPPPRKKTTAKKA